MNPPAISPSVAKEIGDVTNGLLASISHDLGTPLSAILLWTKVLSEQEDLPPQELKDGLQAIRECVEEQLAIIDDIVDTSRIATGCVRLKPERVDLGETLRGTIENLMPLADEMALDLRENIDPTLGAALVDPRRFKQLAGSMVGNAIGRSPRGATVEISCMRHGDSIEISVCDIGESMSSEAIDAVLNHFPSRHSPLNKGTTLYTAAKLARLFGGQLGIRSESNKAGARYTVTLDLPALGALEDEPVTPKTEGPRIGPQELVTFLTSQTEHIGTKA